MVEVVVELSHVALKCIVTVFVEARVRAGVSGKNPHGRPQKKLVGG